VDGCTLTNFDPGMPSHPFDNKCRYSASLLLPPKALAFENDAFVMEHENLNNSRPDPVGLVTFDNSVPYIKAPPNLSLVKGSSGFTAVPMSPIAIKDGG